MKKTFLGTGLLGSGFVKAMLGRGENVRVWNRTTAKAKALESLGAKAFEDVRDAVKDADRIHLALKDDASVDAVLQVAAASFKKGAIIIDHTTTSKEGAIRRTNYWKEKGFIYQHAPVFMGPVNAEEATGFMLFSGDEDVFTILESELSGMTGKLLNLGNETGKAAALKLAGNAFLVCFTFSLRETLGVARSVGLNADDLKQLLTVWNPGAQSIARLDRLTSTDHTNPSWELGMARKDTHLFLDSAENHGIQLALLPVIESIMDKWIKDGYAHHDWTIVGNDYV